MSTQAQKIIEQVQKSGGNFFYLKKGDIHMSIYIHYSKSGLTAKGAVRAYHPKRGIVTYTCTAKGCGYSKKGELSDLILSSGLASFPEVQQALGEKFCVGSGRGISKLRDAGFDVVEM